MELTKEEFFTLSKLVYGLCGIYLHEGKKNLLEARLSKRLRATGTASVRDYLALIRQSRTELDNFIDAVSTNHTYFFRESKHFHCIRPEHVDIWCAACSSGEEPYSIAMHCLERGFRPNILATDISISALKIAKNGIYPFDRAKNMPREMLRKYFRKGKGRWEGYVKVKDEVKDMVTFKRFNLLTGHPPLEAFDVIFCRNVLIYFDKQAKESVVNKLYRAIRPNGLFVIGGAESLNGFKHSFKYIRPSLYQKRSL